MATQVKCTVCGVTWTPDSGDVRVYGACPSCGESAAVAQRCDDCPVLEVSHQRGNCSAGRLLEQVLDHEFDCKHYRIDPGEVPVEVREGLKILEQERGKWEKETREEEEQKREEQRRVIEAQNRR